MSFVKCCFEAGEGHDFLDSFIQKCTDPGCCCGCCSALRPRYKRLVDNIFPASPQDGLVKSNMEKLTFYSLSSPEKLDRIGEYLFQKAARDIYRRRHGFVIIAMEAMDQLLLACHSQTLNLFVESFLKMVQKLLESTDPQLQILATQSFVRFANIEEDTPSYHRRYDFFVSKFSAMCHSNHNDQAVRDNIRLAGIQGLQGVIRKTVSDDLVENIWEAQHMDKIVPSLLYNMQTAEKYETVTCMETDARDGLEDDPPRLAEACLRELVGRASFGHIRSVLRPVLTHFDRHELWVPNDFAVHTFKIIMFSIQVNTYYMKKYKIQMLMTRRASDLMNVFLDVPSRVEYEALGLSVGKCSRPDLIFISKHGYAIFNSLYEGLQLESNNLENISAIYTTLALLFVELASDETVCDMLQLVLSIQQSALSNPVLSVWQQCSLHVVCASLAALVCHVMMLPALQHYITQIVDARREEAPHLLPPLKQYDQLPPSKMPSKLPYLMIDQMALSECLSSCGVEGSRLSSGARYGPAVHRHSWVEAGERRIHTLDLDSANSSPGVQRRIQYDDLDEEYRQFIEKYNHNHRPTAHDFGTYHSGQSESVSLEALVSAARGPSEAERKDAERRRATLNNTFRTAPFTSLLRLTQPKYEIKDKLEEIFNSLSEEPLLAPTANSPAAKCQNAPYNKYFPELFLY
nr:protein EFR3 homolog cmp44E [Danaus plexippus plexippus]